MKIVHRVSLLDQPNRTDLLESLGISLQRSDPGARSFFFDIDENDARWAQLHQLIWKWKVEDGSDPELLWVGTQFSNEESEAAPFVKLSPNWHHGYPYPRPGNFGFLEETYDPKSRCPGNPVGTGLQRTGLCGMGMVQVAPFQMKGEPKWGKKHILQMNWVFGEFFVRPEIWQKVFKPLGIGFEWVLHYKTLKKLETVVQLKVENTAASPLLIPDDHTKETCKVCRRTRYYPWVRGYFPSFRESPGPGHIWKTQEIFGSGGSAWNAVIISAELYREIQMHELKGVTFMPMAPS